MLCEEGTCQMEGLNDAEYVLCKVHDVVAGPRGRVTPIAPQVNSQAAKMGSQVLHLQPHGTTSQQAVRGCFTSTRRKKAREATNVLESDLLMIWGSIGYHMRAWLSVNAQHEQSNPLGMVTMW